MADVDEPWDGHTVPMAEWKNVLCVFLRSPALDELTKLLKEAAFTVITAHSFSSAVQWLHTEVPDVILLDEKFTLVEGLSSTDIIKEMLPNAIVGLVDIGNANLPAIVQAVKDTFTQANDKGAASR